MYKKYKVSLLLPKDKSLLNKGEIVLSINNSEEFYPIPEGFEFEFRVPDDFYYIYDKPNAECQVFNIWLDYHNSSGSKRQIIHLVPQLIC